MRAWKPLLLITPLVLVTSAAVADCGSEYYPLAAVKAHEEGVAIVKVHIDETGAVVGTDIDQSTGFNDLDQATIQCVVKTWHFSPATRNGKPVASTKRYKITWTINPPKQPTAK